MALLGIESNTCQVGHFQDAGQRMHGDKSVEEGMSWNLHGMFHSTEFLREREPEWMKKLWESDTRECGICIIYALDSPITHRGSYKKTWPCYCIHIITLIYCCGSANVHPLKKNLKKFIVIDILHMDSYFKGLWM